jgi:hypothetical protein
MDLQLKSKIVLLYGCQAAAARDFGMTEPRLSRIIHGYDRPTPEQAKVLQEKLGVTFASPAETILR